MFFFIISYWFHPPVWTIDCVAYSWKIWRQGIKFCSLAILFWTAKFKMFAIHRHLRTIVIKPPNFLTSNIPAIQYGLVPSMGYVLYRALVITSYLQFHPTMSCEVLCQHNQEYESISPRPFPSIYQTLGPILVWLIPQLSLATHHNMYYACTFTSLS